MENLNIIRISAKLEEMFAGKIDTSDIKGKDSRSTFYSRALSALAIIIQCGISIDIAVQNITDGYHDLGIDGIFCDDIQKKLILVQSKWRTDGTGGISQEESLAFVEGIRRIISLELTGANERIKRKTDEITNAIRAMDYQIVCVFCHTGNQQISDYSKRPLDVLLSSTNDESSEILSFAEMKQSDIFRFLASGQETDNICIDDVLINNWGSIDETFRAYYGVISAAAIGDWYKNFGNRLFARNIRYYKGSTEVNTGIKKVLLEEPQNFFYYNNGIKLLCKKITRKAAYSSSTRTGLFSLEGVSLVNGAQTTGTIGQVYADNPGQVSNANVFVQLIDLDGADESQALLITRLSNTQNRIDNKEFAALDPTQERLKTELQFSNVDYLYKSGANIEDPSHQISLDEAIVALACINQDVVLTATAKRNVGALTEDIEKPPYKILFNSSTNAFILKNSIEVLRAVDKFLQKREADFQGRSRLALVHGNRFILHLVLQSIKSVEKFDVAIIKPEELVPMIEAECDNILLKVVDAINNILLESYPAIIFKNSGRCKELLNYITNKQ